MIAQAVNSRSSLAKYLRSSRGWVGSNFGAVECPRAGIGVVVAINDCNFGVKICVIEGRGLEDVGGQRGDEVDDCFRRDESKEEDVSEGNRSR